MSLPRVKVPVTLDGEERVLIFSFNALCQAEEMTGMNLLVGDVTFSSVRVLRALVWAGLLHEDPLLTIERAGDLIEGAGADYVLGKIMDAYGKAMPDLEDEDEGSEPPDPPIE